MCFVEGKTSCVCADMFVDWNSCLCWTLWIQNSPWVLLHFVWTVISLLKGNFLIIENLPYIAGIAANKWVEFSISSLSLLFGLVNCITLSNSFYSTNWFYFPSVSTMLDNKALKPFFAILSKWNLAKNFNYNNLKKFYYWQFPIILLFWRNTSTFNYNTLEKDCILRQFPTILLS